MEQLIKYKAVATSQVAVLSLHDALPISQPRGGAVRGDSRRRHRAARERRRGGAAARGDRLVRNLRGGRSEEHTSELQSQSNIVCRPLHEKKKPQLRDENAHNDKSVHGVL